MAAYSAVVCFEQLLISTTDHFPKEEVVSLQVKVSSLKESIEAIFPAPRKERDAANNLGGRIRDVVYNAQDSIESFLLSQGQLVPSDGHKISSTPISLQEIEAIMDPIIIEAEMLVLSITKGKAKLPFEPTTYKAHDYEMARKTRIVGQDEDKRLVIGQLLSDISKRQVIPITGMAGIGKTTLASSIYQDYQIRDEFPYRAWVTVTQDYNVGDILQKLLTSVESCSRKAGEEAVYECDESMLRERLHQTLYNNKYLVVIDDMWDTDIWNRLHLSLPANNNESRVVVTTRIRGVAESIATSSFLHEMKPLDKGDSWRLLSLRTFGERRCPSDLFKIGKQISKNCHGIPLTLTVVGGLLSQESKTTEYWQCIAEDISAAIRGAVVGEAYREILSLSYDHLPPKLKGCFLYMAAFPQETEVVVSKLVKLWVAEGFLPPPLPPHTIEKVAEESLAELINRNIIVVGKRSSDGRIKTCTMVKDLVELAREEAENDNFFYSIKTHVKSGAESQRRVSVHQTAVVCRKQVYQSTKLIKLARSLLYVDPSYPHPIPFCLTFDLLRVFDALTVFFMEFPDEVIKLIHLRYLSFTYNGKLPSSLSKLKHLQILMVHRRKPRIIIMGISFLPEEIWDMPQLRHLLLTETDLPLPRGAENSSILLTNLQSLSNVSAVTCTKEVLQNMPNLKKLGMWIDVPGAVEFHLDQLNQLEAFKFTVLGPIPGSRIEFQPQLSFPRTLRKLSLSGCGLPWEDMRIIGEVPSLEVLKLRELAFQGQEWILEDYTFEGLKFLLIEYLDFEQWEADGLCFPRLERLIIRHCYELQEIPAEIGEGGFLELIELVDCNRSAVKSVEKIRDEQQSFGNERLQVHIKCSWE